MFLFCEYTQTQTLLDINKFFEVLVAHSILMEDGPAALFVMGIRDILTANAPTANATATADTINI